MQNVPQHEQVAVQNIFDQQYRAAAYSGNFSNMNLPMQTSQPVQNIAQQHQSSNNTSQMLHETHNILYSNDAAQYNKHYPPLKVKQH